MRAMPDREPQPRQPLHYNREPYPPGTVVKLARNPHNMNTEFPSRDLIVFVPIGSVGVVFEVHKSVNIVKFYDAEDDQWVAQEAHPWRLNMVEP